MKRHTLATLASLGALLLGAALSHVSLPVQAQTKTDSAAPAGAQQLKGPLTLVVGYAPGGGSDVAARLIAERLRDRLGIVVIVENRTGAGGRLAAQQMRGTPAERLTLMAGNPAVMVVAPLVFKDVGYDPERDFTPVAHVQDYLFGIAVASAVPVRELKHLIAWLKANPSQANFGVPASGSLPHFFGLMVAEKAGVSPQIVGYRGSAPLLTDLIGGHVPVAVDTIDSLQPQQAAGKLRVLASSGVERAPNLRDVPTFRESGINLTASGWNAFFAPASMSPATVKLLGDAIAAVMAEPQTRKAFVDAGMTPVSAGPEQTAKMLKAYRDLWAPVVRRSGFQQ